ncbi:MAG: HDOD domain-containing protein [Ignavibacteria bacterium]|jgi:HD-like signal output (HDOD) protein|nr:HDOD domain-containing protein [Ignavibacteria bacterium]
MLSSKVKRKLESMTDLPSIPTVISAVLSEIDNDRHHAKFIASLIEQDQGLTAKILRVANSPYFGLTRTISTVDLAIVILGTNEIKDIMISLLMKKIFAKVDTKIFNTKEFWKYSIFCGSASRFIARKLKYKLVSEAFVTGLMHDIGLLILMDKFRNNFAKVRRLQKSAEISLTEAEMYIFECTHSDVGAWLAEKWNFPEKIIKALEYHHTPFWIADEVEYADEFVLSPQFTKLKYPLAAIVSTAEWLSYEFGMKLWESEMVQPDYYVTNEFLSAMVDNEILTTDSALAVIKQSLTDEFEKTAMAFE